MEKAASRGFIYSAFMALAFFTTIGHANGNLRLPNNTMPMHYTLRLDTAIDRNIFNYTGNVQIGIVILQPTNQIFLHSTHSRISKIQLRDNAGHQVQIKEFKLDNVTEFLVIEAATLLRVRNGPYTLEIDFTNTVDRTDLAGFYKSSYQNESDAVRYIGVTHFEPINARSAFPCFDELGYKATFELHISCGLTYHVRSNTPVRTIQQLPGDRKLYSFGKTPRMQTYVLAWLVSDFVGEQRVLDRSGLTVATWAKPSSAHLLSYSVDASVRYIRAMEKYFAEPYRLPKIDNVAIPQFSLDPIAMENWGLVTYRENTLYIDPQTNDMHKKRILVKLIAHEYTHQIFGNLLTPQWWSYLWLKEGFASFYEYYLASISHPELDLRNRFIMETMQETFYMDSVATVNPMTYYVEKRSDIEKLYTYVVYSKAACVIRMMNDVLGERTFLNGIRHYIQRNKNLGIVTENDLFDSLDLAAKKDVALPKNLTVHEVFRTWSHQAGYPVVSVRREGNEYFFTQQRYVEHTEDNPFNSSWWIPISFIAINESTSEKWQTFWMAPYVSEVSYTIPTTPQDVVMFNPLSTGLYRVEYDGTMLRGIMRQLYINHTAIQPAARARFLDDTIHLTYKRGNNFGTVLQLLGYLRHEADILPWSIASENIRYMQSMLRTNEKASRLLQSFVETIVAPVLTSHDVLHRSDASDSIVELQAIAIELACGASKTCKTASQSILKPTTHNVSTRYGVAENALLCYGLQQSSVQDRHAFVKQMSHELKENIGCLGTAITSIRSYAHLLFHLSDFDRPKELHRLIVGSKVSPGVLLESIGTELSHYQRQSAYRTSISKILNALSRYAMKASEEKLLVSIASTHVSWIVPEIEQQLRNNHRWTERNVQPLTDALTRFFLRKA